MLTRDLQEQGCLARPVEFLAEKIAPLVGL
jgi:hypothetical protein